MAKQRGYPDQRGLWAESDSIAEQFVPSESHKAQQKAMAQTLLAAGLTPEQVAAMLFVPEDSLQPGSEKMKPLLAIRRKKICEPVFRTGRVAPEPH
jgi:hypothetical protein